MKWILPTILVVLVSGCTGLGEEPEAPDSLPTPVEPESPLLADCVSYETARTLPSGLLRYDGPEDWRPSAPISSVVALVFIECQKVTWGPYSLGPVLLAAMSHSSIRPPDACLQADARTPHYLMGFWTNDSEIADYVSMTVGLPLVAANISYKDQDAGALRSRSIQLDTGLFQASILFDWHALNTQTFEDQFVFFRANSTTVTRMSLLEEYEGSAPDLLESLGTLGGDNPAYNDPSPLWSGGSAIHFNHETRLEVTTWRDLECAEL